MALNRGVITIRNKSHRRINSFKQKEFVATNSVRAESRTAASTETPQGHDSSGRVSSEVITLGTLQDQQENKQALEEEEFETSNREDTATFSPNGDVQCHVHLSTRVTV